MDIKKLVVISITLGVAISLAIGGIGFGYDKVFGGPRIIFSNSTEPGVVFGYPLSWLGVQTSNTFILQKEANTIQVNNPNDYRAYFPSLLADMAIWSIAVFAVCFSISRTGDKKRGGGTNQDRS